MSWAKIGVAYRSVGPRDIILPVLCFVMFSSVDKNSRLLGKIANNSSDRRTTPFEPFSFLALGTTSQNRMPWSEILAETVVNGGVAIRSKTSPAMVIVAVVPEGLTA